MYKDLMESGFIKSAFKNRKTQFISQIPAFLFLAFVIVAGFIGIQNSNMNLATISVWILWWPVLVISLALAGRIWCFMCPVGAAGDWVQRRTFYKKVNDYFSLNRKWPSKYRNLTISAVFFLIITWADFQFNLVGSPANTAYFIVILLAVCVIIAMVFERRSFCRYACPLTGLIGLYSMFAPLELRVKKKDACQTCKEKYCITGNENGYPCPVLEYPGTMDRNTYCILCTECAKTCHKNNISLNLRNFGAEFSNFAKIRIDEGMFILILVGVTVFQTLVMVRPWEEITANIMMSTGYGYDFVRAGLFIASAVLFILIYSFAILFSKNRSLGAKDLFAGYSYSFIPLGLMMFLAHNIRHLLQEGAAAVRVISDPLGFGLNLFGISGDAPAPLVDNNNILLIQWILMFAGLGFSISSGRSISRRFFHDKGFVPVMILMIALFILYLWLLGQPILHKH